MLEVKESEASVKSTGSTNLLSISLPLGKALIVELFTEKEKSFREKYKFI